MEGMGSSERSGGGLRAQEALNMFKLIHEYSEEKRDPDPPTTGAGLTPAGPDTSMEVEVEKTTPISAALAAPATTSAQPTTGMPLGKVDYPKDSHQAVSAALQASDILNDFVRVLRLHMEISDVDEIIDKIAGLKKTIQDRIFWRPRAPYARGTVIQMMRPNFMAPRLPGAMASIPKAGAAVVEPLGEAKAGIGLISGVADPKVGGDINGSNATSPDDFALEQTWNRALQNIKTTAKDYIKAWVYQVLPSYKFVKYVAGAMYEDNSERFVSFDAAKQIYLYWLIINAHLDQRKDARGELIVPPHLIDAVRDFRFTSIEMVQEFIDNHSAEMVDSHIEEDMNNPLTTCDNIFSPTLLQAKGMAWTILNAQLIKLKKKNPGMRGFSTYSAYKGPDGTPDFRLVLLPLPKGTTVHLMAEFAALVAALMSKNKMTAGTRQATHWEMDQHSPDVLQALSGIMAKLASMGFA